MVWESVRLQDSLISNKSWISGRIILIFLHTDQHPKEEETKTWFSDRDGQAWFQSFSLWYGKNLLCISSSKLCFNAIVDFIQYFLAHVRIMNRNKFHMEKSFSMKSSSCYCRIKLFIWKGINLLFVLLFISQKQANSAQFIHWFTSSCLKSPLLSPHPLHPSLYICIYVYMYVCVCIYITVNSMHVDFTDNCKASKEEKNKILWTC